MVEQQLLQIIKSELNGAPPPEMTDDWEGLADYARKQGVLPYVAKYAAEIKGNKPPERVGMALKQSLLADQVCHEQQMYAVRELQATLEKAGVDNLAFKGAATKFRYPDPLLRPMDDIDFLYKPEQDKQLKAVMKALSYSEPSEGRKNDKYERKPFVCIEAHRQMVSGDSPYASYCAGAWVRARRKAGCAHIYEMTIEDELIFNLIHLAGHLIQGGAGVRFIADVYVYDHIQLNRKYLHDELGKIGLLQLYENVTALANCWFGDGITTETSEKLGAFVLAGGTFGTAERAAALAANRGRARYFLNQCFPSCAEMLSMFPWLKGKKLLLPYAWVLRGTRSFLYRREHLKSIFRLARTGNGEQGRELEQFYREIGLHV